MKQGDICHLDFNCDRAATNHYMGQRHKAMVKMVKMKRTRENILKAQGVDPPEDDEKVNYHVESESSRLNKRGRLGTH